MIKKEAIRLVLLILLLMITIGVIVLMQRGYDANFTETFS